jgi:hypothetical protein
MYEQYPNSKKNHKCNPKQHKRNKFFIQQEFPLVDSSSKNYDKNSKVNGAIINELE